MAPAEGCCEVAQKGTYAGWVQSSFFAQAGSFWRCHSFPSTEMVQKVKTASRSASCLPKETIQALYSSLGQQSIWNNCARNTQGKYYSAQELEAEAPGKNTPKQVNFIFIISFTLFTGLWRCLQSDPLHKKYFLRMTNHMQDAFQTHREAASDVLWYQARPKVSRR